MSFFLKKINQQDSHNNQNCAKGLKAAYYYFPIPYQSLDINGNLLDVNLAWLNVLGYARGKVIGKNFSEFLPTSEKKIFKTNFSDFKKKGTICDVSYSLRKKDDTWISVEFNGTIEYNDNGEFKLTHCMFQDMTEKKIAEEKIIKSEKKYKELFKGAPIGLYEIDYVNKKFIEVNDAMCVLLGYSRYELLSKSPQSIMTKKSQIKVLKFLALIELGKKAPRRVDLEVKTKAGAILQARLYVNFLKKHGKIVGARVVAQDITELKKNQEKVNKNEKKFRMIFDSSPLVIALFDKKGVLLDVNQKAHDWLGYNRDELIGKNMINLPILGDGAKTILLENFTKRMSGKVIKAYDVNFKTKHGELRAGRITASVVKNEQDKVVGDLVMLSDITQEKKAQIALEASEEQSKLITENTSDLISIIDFSSEAKFLYLNLAHTKILGWSLPDYLGKSAVVLVHPDDQEKLQSLLGEYLRVKKTKNISKNISNSSANLEYRIKNAKGDWQLLSSTINFVANKIVIVSRDITKQKKSEEKLRKSEENLQKTEEIGKLGSWGYDIASGKLWGSNQAKKIFGFEKDSEEFSLDEIESLMPDQARIHNVLENLIKNNKPYNVEYDIVIGSARRSRSIHSIARLMYDENKKPVKVIGMVQDISERKKVEEKLLSSEREWSETFDSMSDGVSVHSISYDILNVNKALCALIGKSREELIGKKCFNVFHDRESPIDECPMVTTLRTKEDRLVEVFEKKFNKWLSIYTSPIFDKQGKIRKIIHVVRDITERKQVEAEMSKRNQDLEKLNKLTIGRELKMIELKKKMKALENK